MPAQLVLLPPYHYDDDYNNHYKTTTLPLRPRPRLLLLLLVICYHYQVLALVLVALLLLRRRSMTITPTSTGKSNRANNEHHVVGPVWWQLSVKDPDSSAAAFYFATAWNYFVTISIVVTILQGGQSPMLPPATEGLIQTCVEAAGRSKLWKGAKQQSRVNPSVERNSTPCYPIQETVWVLCRP